MALNQNFFPKTYKTLQMVEGSLKAAEKQFDLRDWIAPFLIEEFGIKTVEKAVKNLQLSFWELCDYKTVSSRSPQMLAYYPVNLIHRQEVVTKWGRKINFLSSSSFSWSKLISRIIFGGKVS